MNYPISEIKTKVEANDILKEADKRKKDLQYQISTVQRQHENASESNVEVDAELASVKAEYDAINTAFPSMPESETKKSMSLRLKKLTWRKELLENRDEEVNIVTLILKQLTISQYEKEIEAIDDLVSKINTVLPSLA